MHKLSGRAVVAVERPRIGRGPTAAPDDSARCGRGGSSTHDYFATMSDELSSAETVAVTVDGVHTVAGGNQPGLPPLRLGACDSAHMPKSCPFATGDDPVMGGPSRRRCVGSPTEVRRRRESRPSSTRSTSSETAGTQRMSSVPSWRRFPASCRPTLPSWRPSRMSRADRPVVKTWWTTRRRLANPESLGMHMETGSLAAIRPKGPRSLAVLPRLGHVSNNFGHSVQLY